MGTAPFRHGWRCTHAGKHTWTRQGTVAVQCAVRIQELRWSAALKEQTPSTDWLQCWGNSHTKTEMSAPTAPQSGGASGQRCIFICSAGSSRGTRAPVAQAPHATRRLAPRRGGSWQREPSLVVRPLAARVRIVPVLFAGRHAFVGVLVRIQAAELLRGGGGAGRAASLAGQRASPARLHLGQCLKGEPGGKANQGPCKLAMCTGLRGTDGQLHARFGGVSGWQWSRSPEQGTSGWVRPIFVLTS